jgi:hypothetical protein
VVIEVVIVVVIMIVVMVVIMIVGVVDNDALARDATGAGERREDHEDAQRDQSGAKRRLHEPQLQQSACHSCAWRERGVSHRASAFLLNNPTRAPQGRNALVHPRVTAMK